MRIHTDHNGVAVNAISMLADGTVVEGHHYQIIAGGATHFIDFQHGPVKENGVNGVTNEALLAILIHRTEFLNEQFPCEENKAALAHMYGALSQFESRTRDRQVRQVEGLNKA